MAVSPRALIDKLNPACRAALVDEAIRVCMSRTHFHIELEHWLTALLASPNNDLGFLLRQYAVDANRVKTQLEGAMAKFKTGNTRPPGFSTDILDAIQAAWVFGSLECGAPRVRSAHLLYALVSDRNLSGKLAGKVAIMHGPVMAAADGFRITIKGQGGHGAYPEATIDAVVIAAQIVQAIQQIVSRRIPAIEPAVVTIGSIHSSSIRGNVISDRVELLGTIRSFNEDIRKKLIKEVDRVCSMAKALGGDYETEYEMGYPATVNEPRITEVMRKAAVDTIGAENVIAVPLKTWAEDFSMLAQAAPGCFMFLGGEIAGDRRAHHSPTFDLDESGLHIGPAILAETARRLLLES